MSKPKKLMKGNLNILVLFLVFGSIFLLASVYYFKLRPTEYPSIKGDTSQLALGDVCNAIQYWDGALKSGPAGSLTHSYSFWTGNQGADIPAGCMLLISVATVGTGEITISDSRNNSYSLLVKQNIDKGASVYVFSSLLSTTLKANDSITFASTSAVSFASYGKVIPGKRVNVARIATKTGFGTNISTPTIVANANSYVVAMTGFRARDGEFGTVQVKLSDGGFVYMGGSSSGSVGKSENNSDLMAHSFFAPTTGEYQLNIPITTPKSRSGYAWASVSVAVE